VEQYVDVYGIVKSCIVRDDPGEVVRHAWMPMKPDEHRQLQEQRLMRLTRGPIDRLYYKPLYHRDLFCCSA